MCTWSMRHLTFDCTLKCGGGEPSGTKQPSLNDEQPVSDAECGASEYVAGVKKTEQGIATSLQYSKSVHFICNYFMVAYFALLS